MAADNEACQFFDSLEHVHNVAPGKITADDVGTYDAQNPCTCPDDDEFIQMIWGICEMFNFSIISAKEYRNTIHYAYLYSVPNCLPDHVEAANRACPRCISLIKYCWKFLGDLIDFKKIMTAREKHVIVDGKCGFSMHNALYTYERVFHPGPLGRRTKTKYSDSVMDHMRAIYGFITERIDIVFQDAIILNSLAVKFATKFIDNYFDGCAKRYEEKRIESRQRAFNEGPAIHSFALAKIERAHEIEFYKREKECKDIASSKGEAYYAKHYEAGNIYEIECCACNKLYINMKSMGVYACDGMCSDIYKGGHVLRPGYGSYWDDERFLVVEPGMFEDPERICDVCIANLCKERKLIYFIEYNIRGFPIFYEDMYDAIPEEKKVFKEKMKAVCMR